MYPLCKSVQLAGFLLLVESVEADDCFPGALVHVPKPILELDACTLHRVFRFRWGEGVIGFTLFRVCSSPGSVVGSELHQTDSLRLSGLAAYLSMRLVW